MDRPDAPLRFLVVEDEALPAMDLGMLIEDAGHGVVAEAACLREVQGLDDGIDPHVAFVDLHLAERSSGLDVCAHIQSPWAGAIIVFVTASPRKLPDDHAGAHAVIAKPFSRSSMMSALRYVTEGICDPPPSLPTPREFTAFPPTRGDLEKLSGCGRLALGCARDRQAALANSFVPVQRLARTSWTDVQRSPG